MSNGHLLSCGYGGSYDQGLNSTSNVPSFTRVLGDLAQVKVTKVCTSSTSNHAFAIDSQRRVYGWGRGDDYGLGTAETNNVAEPALVRIPAFCKVKGVAIGCQFSFATTEENEIFAFGCGSSYCLGLGSSTNEPMPRRLFVPGCPSFSQPLIIKCGHRAVLACTPAIPTAPIPSRFHRDFAKALYGAENENENENSAPPFDVAFIFPNHDNAKIFAHKLILCIPVRNENFATGFKWDAQNSAKDCKALGGKNSKVTSIQEILEFSPVAFKAFLEFLYTDSVKALSFPVVTKTPIHIPKAGNNDNDNDNDNANTNSRGDSRMGQGLTESELIDWFRLEKRYGFKLSPPVFEAG